jgi:hypothetical protein
MKCRRNFVGALPFLCLFITVSLLGQTERNHPRLTFVRGDVTISKGVFDRSETARLGMKITGSTRLNTGDNGLAEIEFSDGSKLRIAGRTDAQFIMLEHKPAWKSSNRNTVLKLSKGTIYFLRQVADREFFHVNINHLWWLAVPGVVEYRASAEGDTASLSIFEGSVYANMAIYSSLKSPHRQAGELRINAHESIIADAETGLVKDANRSTGSLGRDEWKNLQEHSSRDTVVGIPEIPSPTGASGNNNQSWYPMCERANGAIVEYAYDESLLSALPLEFVVHCTPWVCGGSGVFPPPGSLGISVPYHGGSNPYGLNGSMAQCEKELGRTPGYDPPRP